MRNHQDREPRELEGARRRARGFRRWGWLLGWLGWLWTQAGGQAAPFDRELRYTQPDGTVLQLQARGDEFQAICETRDGYTVVFVPERRAYHFAQAAREDGSWELSALPVGQADPTRLGIARHLRPPAAAARQAARQRREARDQALRLPERWARLKGEQLHPAKATRLQPPRQTTTGVKVGLCVLIDFDDAPAAIPRSKIEAFLNGDDYRDYGNYGSVKQFYWDNSNGLLLYTNVVTAYVRIPNSLHPRAYYDDVSRRCEHAANLLIRDALEVLTHLPAFQAEIQPQLRALTLDEQDRVVAANFLFAGPDSGVWSYGLWPNSGALNVVGPQPLWPDGPQVDTYQISNLGGSLAVAVFAHENGHLLCGFPDLYDYDQDSVGGGGLYCLMGIPVSFTHPQQFCAYLKAAAGWARVTDLRPGAAVTGEVASAGDRFNRFYRYPKPAANTDVITDTEYFLIENRQRSGWDELLPGAGVAVWHIDELGSYNNQDTSPNTGHANYEVALVQADGRLEFERNEDYGDALDLFYAGNPAANYANRFADDTAPAALWWDGSRSGLTLADFSASATTMRFSAQVTPPVIWRDPLSQVVSTGQVVYLSVTPATNDAWRFQWLKDGAQLVDDGRIVGAQTSRLTLYDARLGDAGQYRAVLTLGAVEAVSRLAEIDVRADLPLISVDVGDASLLPGRTLLTDAGCRVEGAGSDIGGTADGFRWSGRWVPGDVDVRARLVRLDYSTDAAKAGLTLRASLDPGSPHVSLLASPYQGDNALVVVVRQSPNGESAELHRSALVWSGDIRLRLVREDNRVSAYRREANGQWTLLEVVPVNWAGQAFAGLAVTSRDLLKTTVAEFVDYLTVPLTRSAVLTPAVSVYPPTAGPGEVWFRGQVPWRAVSEASWIQLEGEIEGAQDGRIAYRLEANPGATERLGTVRVAGVTHTVWQAPSLRLRLKDSAVPLPPLALAVGPGQRLVIEASGDLSRWTPCLIRPALASWDLEPIAPTNGVFDGPARFFRAWAR